MHARMITTQVRMDAIDEAIKHWSEGQGPTLQERGFKRNALLVDRQTGKVVVVSFWETEADARESALGLQERWDSMQQQGLLTAEATIEHFEVPAGFEGPQPI